MELVVWSVGCSALSVKFEVWGGLCRVLVYIVECWFIVRGMGCKVLSVDCEVRSVLFDPIREEKNVGCDV